MAKGKTNGTVATAAARLLGTPQPCHAPGGRQVGGRVSCPAAVSCPPHGVGGGNSLPCPERSTVFRCPVFPSKSSMVYLPLSCGVGSLICSQICSPVTPVFTRSVNLSWVSLRNTTHGYPACSSGARPVTEHLCCHLTGLPPGSGGPPPPAAVQANSCSRCGPAGQSWCGSRSLSEVSLPSERAQRC